MKAIDDIYSKLPEDTQIRLGRLFSSIHFTESQKLEIVKEEADLRQWKEKSFTELFDYDSLQSMKNGRQGESYLRELRKHMLSLRRNETDYSDFHPTKKPAIKAKAVVEDSAILLGKCPCPVDGEKTRCCKLRTLDAVQQCSFGCSYCSVQAFYNENQIRVVDNLSERLRNIDIDDDVWHIGTGQASDSLLWGDDFGTLTALSEFAKNHPGIVIELKSKAARNVFDHQYPRNMVFTWSLNAPTIIEKEEHFTATLEDRLASAQKARDMGNLVGFHIHPMVLFKGWEEEYTHIAKEIERRFRAEDICMISIGTLTFTKAVLKRLRQQGAESRVLEMELSPAAGKFSYPLKTKERMFKHVHSSFSENFRKEVFFYLCMEDPSLWMPVLGREYSSDKAFEMDMKESYLSKIRKLMP